MGLSATMPASGLRPSPDGRCCADGSAATRGWWLARFRRRSIVVSKAKRRVDASIALFARFAGNNRIGDLASMLA